MCTDRRINFFYIRYVSHLWCTCIDLPCSSSPVLECLLYNWLASGQQTIFTLPNDYCFLFLQELNKHENSELLRWSTDIGLKLCRQDTQHSKIILHFPYFNSNQGTTHLSVYRAVAYICYLFFSWPHRLACMQENQYFEVHALKSEEISKKLFLSLKTCQRSNFHRKACKSSAILHEVFFFLCPQEVFTRWQPWANDPKLKQIPECLAVVARTPPDSTFFAKKGIKHWIYKRTQWTLSLRWTPSGLTPVFSLIEVSSL